MSSRFADRVTFRLERLLVRGAQYRLLVIAAGLGLISLLGGAAVLAAGSGFSRFDEAIWWAFLRLSDPGYLGDDVGSVNRVVSTILTVLGYVVFLGALVAVMTQWLNQRMARLEAGLTPVARDGHVVVLGWTNRTEAILREILASPRRVRRFLRARGTRDLHVVVLAGHVDAALAQDLRDALGDAWEEHRITLRSGTPLRAEHLDRVDAANAAAVIIPASEQAAGAERADTHTIKALLSLARGAAGPLPYVVAEVLATDKARLAERIYPGEIEVVRSHAVVSRLIAQNVRHAGLSRIYNQLLTQREGAEIYIRESAAFAGQRVGTVRTTFPSAVLLGVVRPGRGDLHPLLNPSDDVRIEDDDRLVLLARAFQDTEPDAGPRPTPAHDGSGVARAEGGGGVEAVAGASSVTDTAAAARPPTMSRAVEEAARRVLVLGWNHEVPALLEEFGSYRGEAFEIVIASVVPEAERRHHLRHTPASPRLVVEHSVSDSSDLHELRALEPASFDVVLFLGSDWLETSEESDARTVLGVLLLQQVLEEAERRPDVIVELLDPDNVRLLGDGAAEVIISPLVVSHMLAQVALRRELLAVFEELFTAGGAEIAFRPSRRYAAGAGKVTFADLERAARARGETALGVRGAAPGRALELVPARTATWRADDGLEVVVLAREE